MSARKEVEIPAAPDGKPLVQREDVRLTKDHIHKRQQCKAGDTISVLPHQKAWLLQLGKIDPSTEGETI